MSTTLQAFVHTLRFEAQDTISVELRPVGGGEWPAFTAGSHIDLHLPNGLVRSYSLSNDSRERHRYVVGVLRDRASRGGSRCVHEALRVGMPISISEPRNHFALDEGARHSVLVAGGIGITPMLCMARRLQSQGSSFEMLYFARDRQSAAFLAELQALGMPLQLHFDAEAGGPPDLRALLAQRTPDAGLHHYACGPTPMLDAFEKHCSELGHAHAHVERFSPVEVQASSDARSHYTVELKRSGRFIEVTPDKSLLDTLLAAGVNIDHSCCEGVCGSCETRVLGGVPDHRDSVLSAKEKASNKLMMLCVSGCKSQALVLDI
ncbi:ferredoxin-NADP reductase [Comamonas sp. BIGb0152]|uniref:PDR/VanB family oxidoreductase n=1 Tax=Comamonas sp. BIGb0152 TaxID=2940601 RepID=UPI00216A6C71|nr:PDR/VanB family oxidoreductase [Comamonas sp. BIGb0152]MCS4295898.1 ferredoxin-NADP reductase [Comamonas sp. BIGb0152]